MKEITNQSLRNAKQLITNSQENIARINDPHATRIEASTSSSAIGVSLKNVVTYSNPVDPFAADIRLDNITTSAKAETISNVLGNYQNILSGAVATEAKIVKAFDDFAAAASSLTNLNDLSARQAFIDKGQRLASTLNDTVDGFKSLRSIAHNEYVALIQEANSETSSLFKLNQEINRVSNVGGGAFRLFNTRDKLVAELAEKFKIDVSYAHNGAALVSLAGSGVGLVSNNNYAKFVASGNFIQDEGVESLPEDLSLTIESIKRDGTEDYKLLVLGGGMDEEMVQGGKLEGLITLRDKSLKDGLDAVKLLANTITTTINEIHNNGSPWPPKSVFVSEMSVSELDVLDLQGTLSLFALDKDGFQLQGSGGRLHERKIDFSTLRTNDISGKPTVRDVINEINMLLDKNPSRPRAALGQIMVDDGNANVLVSPNEFLVNNVQLVGTSGVVNGEMSFDFELDGNSYFGSKVEIVEVQGPNGLLAANDLPADFRLEKDTSLIANRQFKVDGLVAGNNNIAVHVRVTGDNGVISDGTVQFVVNLDGSATMNKRFAFDGNQLNIVGDFQAKIPSHSGVAVAKLVDDNGVEIMPGQGGTMGKLVIETNSNEYRLGLQGSNFSKLLGLNDLFKKVNGNIVVRDDIIADSNNLSAGLIDKANGALRAVKVGDTKAASVFNIVLAGGDFANGDNFTIDGKTFTFGVAPGNVVLGGNLDASINAMVTAINNDPALKAKIVAINPGLGALRIEAINGGTWANAVAIGATLLAGSTATINGGGAAAVVGGTLLNGTDKLEQARVFDYSIGDKSSQVFEKIFNLGEDIRFFEGGGIIASSTISLQGFTSSIISSLSNQANDAKAESEVRVRVFEQFDKDYKNRFGVNREQEYMKALEFIEFYKLAASLSTQIHKVISDVNSIIAA